MSTVDPSAFAAGFGLGLGLIVAIGAQNAFVLRQGLRREHVGPIVACCAAADAALIALGVAGLSGLLAAHPAVARAMAVAGALFLAAYGLAAARRALRAASLEARIDGPRLPLRVALLQLAGFTLLNPHTYLDTVVLVGSVGAQQAGALKWHFTAGAAAASGVWFASLGYGARLLAPWFRHARAWRLLDAGVALVMLGLATVVARGAWSA